MAEISDYYRIQNTYENTESQEKIEKPKTKAKPCYMMLYSITHMIIAIFALYLSWKCNQRNGLFKFNLVEFVFALFCPHFYIIWAVAMKGGCGVFE
jgi:hypothetical protein